MHDCVNGTIDWIDVFDKMFWRLLFLGFFIRMLYVQAKQTKKQAGVTQR